MSGSLIAVLLCSLFAYSVPLLPTTEFHSIKTTPRNFLRDYTGTFDPNKACSLVNDPRFDLDKLYTVDRLGNVIGGQPVLYVNTSVEQMKDSVIKTIKAGLPVFFGCDVSAAASLCLVVSPSGRPPWDLADLFECVLILPRRFSNSLTGPVASWTLRCSITSWPTTSS